MPGKENWRREGYPALMPYVLVKEAESFIQFLQQVFDGEEIFRAPGEDGGIMHAEVRVGDSVVELSSGNPTYPVRPVELHVYVPDADAWYQRALDAGAESVAPPVDQDYGDREATVRDPWGNLWYIATHQGDSPGPEAPQYRPKGLRTITPFLHLKAAHSFVEFSEQAFDAELLVNIQSPDGKIAYGLLEIGDSRLEVSEAHGQWQPMPANFHLYVPDCDAAYKEALKAGAKSISEPADQHYGERSAGVTDPAGNQWYLATAIAT